MLVRQDPPRLLKHTTPNAELNNTRNHFRNKKVRGPRRVLLSGQCIACNNRSTFAKKINDFWIEYCDTHIGQTIELNSTNIHRVGKYVDA